MGHEPRRGRAWRGHREVPGGKADRDRIKPRERNEIIIYWLPRMQQNEFNYITFHTEDYAAEVPLEVTPQPDSVLRVFMVYASVPEYFEGQPQHFDGLSRDGYKVVE